MLSKRPSDAVKMMSPSCTSKEELSAASGLRETKGAKEDHKVKLEREAPELLGDCFKCGIEQVRSHPDTDFEGGASASV